MGSKNRHPNFFDFSIFHEKSLIFRQKSLIVHWFLMKIHTLAGKPLDRPRDLAARRMSIFRTYTDLLQTRSLCLILHKITISRVCMKPNILFPIQKIFFDDFFCSKKFFDRNFQKFFFNCFFKFFSNITSGFQRCRISSFIRNKQVFPKKSTHWTQMKPPRSLFLMLSRKWTFNPASPVLSLPIAIFLRAVSTSEIQG